MAPTNHGYADELAVPPANFGMLNAADASATLVMQPFRRTDLTHTSGKITGVSNLLAAFRVEQDTDKLRVIDSDGSVYLGFVSQAPETAKAPAAAFRKSDAQKDAVSAAPASVAEKQPQALRAYRFRISGTNRTLKEEIVFTGIFLTKTGDIPAPVATPAPTEAVGGSIAPMVTRAEPVPLELRKARMEGRLSLGGTNLIQINAVPAKQP
jgi:hypothetical protein